MFSGFFTNISDYLSGLLQEFPEPTHHFENYGDPNYWNAWFNESLIVFLEDYPQLSSEEITERLAQMQTLIGPARLSLLVYQNGLIDICQDSSDEHLTMAVNHQFALLRSRLQQDEVFTVNCFEDDFNAIGRNIELPDDYPLLEDFLSSYADWFSAPIYRALLQRVNEKVRDYLRKKYPKVNAHRPFTYHSLKKDWQEILNTCSYQSYENHHEPLLALEENAQHEEAPDNMYGFWQYTTLLLMGTHLITLNGEFQYRLTSLLTAILARNNPLEANSLSVALTALSSLSFIPAINAQSLYDTTAFPRDSTVSETPITDITEEKQTDPFCLTLASGELAVFVVIGDKAYFEVFARDGTLIHPLTLVFDSTGIQSLSIQPAAAHPNGGFGLTLQEETENEVIVRYLHYDQTYNQMINTVVQPASESAMYHCTFENPEPIPVIQRNQYVTAAPLVEIFLTQLLENPLPLGPNQLEMYLLHDTQVFHQGEVLNYENPTHNPVSSAAFKDLSKVIIFYPTTNNNDPSSTDLSAFYYKNPYASDTTLKVNTTPCKNLLFFAKILSDGESVVVTWSCDSKSMKIAIIDVFRKLLVNELELGGNLASNVSKMPVTPTITSLSNNQFVIGQPVYTEWTRSYTDIALQSLQYQNGIVTVLKETFANTNTHFIKGRASSDANSFDQFSLVFSSYTKEPTQGYGTFIQKMDSSLNKLPFNQKSVEPMPGSSCNRLGSCDFSIQINVHTIGEQISPAVIMLNLRKLLILWQSQYDSFKIVAMMIDADSRKLLKPEFQLLTNSSIVGLWINIPERTQSDCFS